MKQQPSRLKYRKNHKVSSSFFFLKDRKNFLPLYGRFALKSIESGKLTFKQIESARKSIRRNINKQGKVFIRVFTSKSVTRKPIAVRMGKGKGSHSFWMCPIRAGQVIFEVSNVDATMSFKALKRASCKLAVKCKVVSLFF